MLLSQVVYSSNSNPRPPNPRLHFQLEGQRAVFLKHLEQRLIRMYGRLLGVESRQHRVVMIPERPRLYQPFEPLHGVLTLVVGEPRTGRNWKEALKYPFLSCLRGGRNTASILQNQR